MDSFMTFIISTSAGLIIATFIYVSLIYEDVNTLSRKIRTLSEDIAALERKIDLMEE